MLTWLTSTFSFSLAGFIGQTAKSFTKSPHRNQLSVLIDSRNLVRIENYFSQMDRVKIIYYNSVDAEVMTWDSTDWNILCLPVVQQVPSFLLQKQFQQVHIWSSQDVHVDTFGHQLLRELLHQFHNARHLSKSTCHFHFSQTFRHNIKEHIWVHFKWITR